MYRLAPEQESILTRARALARGAIADHAGLVDADGRFPREAIEALGGAGFLGLTVPEDLGGMGQGMRVMAAVVDELAQADASAAMVYTMHLAGVNCLLADPQRFAPQLRAAARGRHLSTLAFSEKGSRSHFWAPVSKAVAAGADGQVTLSAEKSWVTSATEADSIVSSCGAAGADGVSVVVILKGDPGVAVSGGWGGLGMRGNMSSPMSFASVPLRLADRLVGQNGKGDDIMLGRALPVFQICQGAIGVGLAEAAFQAAQGHITSKRFDHLGTKLSDLPNLRAALARMRLETDKARAYLAATLDKLEAGAPDTMIHLLAVKASSGEAAVAVTDLAMRACGGAAFSRHLPLERCFRDARASIVMSPTTDHLNEFVGRVLVGLPLFG
jgi:alkylation response protein AidB-like acyl-CoA dehydrogenase